jgi:acyl-CoA synthetase (AMP-forming)/AMP-acid ligase II
VPICLLELTFGVLGDLFGRKRLLVGGAVVLALGETVAVLTPGTASSTGTRVLVLWIGQIIAGIGAAALFPTSLAMVAAGTHTARDRARSITIWAAGLSAGGVISPVLGGRVEDQLGVRFSIVFGTTECSPLLTQVRLDADPDDRAETLGTPLPQTEIQVTSPAGRTPLPAGEVGELRARGYMVMRGYHDAPEATARAIDADGWYHTGDLASVDARGYLRIEGRIKDVIIRGGENIYPREIEDVLFAHPGVAEAAVVGVPDPGGARWWPRSSARHLTVPRRLPTSCGHTAESGWHPTRHRTTGSSSTLSR